MTVIYHHITDEDNDVRLDRWFKRYQGMSHIQVEKALRKGNIRVNGKRVKSNYRMQQGDEVRVPPVSKEEAAHHTQQTKTKREVKVSASDIEFIQSLVIYKDKDLIAINKPAGLAVQGGTKINKSVDGLLDHLKFDSKERPKLVHRLDKDTSGILLLARTAKAATWLTEGFREKTIRKEYLAIIRGRLPQEEGVIDVPLAKLGSNYEKMTTVKHVKDGQRAITEYQVLDYAAEVASLVRLTPITGRTHQLRVHMEWAYTPIIGDGKYGGKEAFIDGMPNKLHLHAMRVTINRLGVKPLVIQAKIPASFKEGLDFLGLSTVSF